MAWFILKVGILIAAGIYSGLAIGGKNPDVAAKTLSVHEHTTAWLYKWVPALYNLIKGWVS